MQYLRYQITQQRLRNTETKKRENGAQKHRILTLDLKNFQQRGVGA